MNYVGVAGLGGGMRNWPKKCNGKMERDRDGGIGMSGSISLQN